MSKSFLLVGGNFINKGAEAMLKTVQAQILDIYPNAKVYVFCRYNEREIAERQGFIPVYRNLVGVRKLAYQFYSKSTAKLSAFVGIKPLPFADITPMTDMKKKIKSLDMGIDVSGYAYGDTRDYRQPLETMKAMKYCQQLGGKFVFMPQAWGSFTLPKVIEKVKEMLEMSDDYFVRDEVSRDYMAGLLGKPASSIPVYPDIAFSFRKPDPAIGAKILADCGRKESNKKLIVVAPNMRVYARVSGQGKQNEYASNLIEICKYIVNELDMDVALVPNETRPAEGYHPDDRFICRLIHEEVNIKDRCFFVDKYHSAEEVKSIIGNADIVLASRFHSLIFSLSQGIPSMAISWSHKYAELFRLFNLEHLVVEDENMNLELIYKLLNDLVANKTVLSGKITEALPKINEKLAIPLSKISLA